MRFILFIILLCLAPLFAKADKPRCKDVFTSSNGKYELRYTSGESPEQKWVLIKKDTEKSRYTITSELSCMRVLVADDGKNVVAVNDYGGKPTKGKPTKDLEVLLFFREGVQIKKYTLGELLNDTTNISSSISHFRWFFGLKPLSNSDSKLNLTTYELVHYTFDMENGNILKNERDEVLTDDAIYVYGKIKKLSKGLYEIEVCHRVFGAVPKNGIVKFEADENNKIFVNQNSSIIVRSGKLVSKQDVMLNSCNYKK